MQGRESPNILLNLTPTKPNCLEMESFQHDELSTLTHRAISLDRVMITERHRKQHPDAVRTVQRRSKSLDAFRESCLPMLECHQHVPNSIHQCQRDSCSPPRTRQRDDVPRMKSSCSANEIFRGPMLPLPQEIIKNLRQDRNQSRSPDQDVQDKQRNGHRREESGERYYWDGKCNSRQRKRLESNHWDERRDRSRHTSCIRSGSLGSAFVEARDPGEDDEIWVLRSNHSPESIWVATLEDIKTRHRKKFKELFGSVMFSDDQWIKAFRDYKGHFLSGFDKALGTLDLQELWTAAVGGDEFRETPKEVFLNTARKFTSDIGRRKRRNMDQDKSLEVWLIDKLWEVFRNEYVRAEVGSKADFDREWESLEINHPEMEKDLAEILDESDQVFRKFLEPDINGKDARTAMKCCIEEPLQLQAMLLLANTDKAQKNLIIPSQVAPELIAIIERIHSINKQIDRVLYGLPFVKKSQKFLASQELEAFEYFRWDEANLIWRSAFATLNLSLSERSMGAQVSKSALKAKSYYDLILDAASLQEQLWLHEKLREYLVNQELFDFSCVERKIKTLQSFVRSANPKARRISTLMNTSISTGMSITALISIQHSLTVLVGQPNLRKRNVRRASRENNSARHGLPEDASNVKEVPTAVEPLSQSRKDSSNSALAERSILEHLLIRLRQIRETPCRRAVLAFMVDRKAILVLLPCFIAFSAVFTGVSLVAATTDPNTSNFYEQLSSFSQMLFSLYCLTVPLIRASNPAIRSFWLRLAIATSAFAGIFSVVLFYMSQQASISLSFVSGTAQIVATILLIEGVDEVVRNPPPESTAYPRAASRTFEDEVANSSRRAHDEEAVRPDPLYSPMARSANGGNPISSHGVILDGGRTLQGQRYRTESYDIAQLPRKRILV